MSIESIKAILKESVPPKNDFVHTLKEVFHPALAYSQPLEEGIALYDMGYREAGVKYLFEAFQPEDNWVTRNLLLNAIEHLNG